MKKIIATIVTLVPSFALAQAITDVNSLTYKLTNLGNTLIGVLIAFAPCSDNDCYLVKHYSR